ncbi:Peptidoglycan-binding Lysin subgroup [Penicillium hispanicum]|uniref:Peptidoglycan-binding Lysin subgroup n=1 Tax=Penicillium hispanicum TaxID=1080232 RepID=UPI002541C945|nr:Peptidoglycan-binding Lysin subgroup [Penicillium hispanicum]KAJ5591614.1 Peptidoglycan-binding Lysin subgroup [Penicillium hispanicum]
MDTMDSVRLNQLLANYCFLLLYVMGISAVLAEDSHQHLSIQKRSATCPTIRVISGDTCATLADRCGITMAELNTYNTRLSCSSLSPESHVCCSLEESPSAPPTPDSDGLCYNYTIQAYDTCSEIAKTYDITEAEIGSYNSRTWGWNGCQHLEQGDFICLSTGEPPMPVALPNAVCGPQVPGTVRPSDMADLAALNPCPLSQCCTSDGLCVKTGTEGCISGSSSIIASSASVVSDGGSKHTTSSAQAAPAIDPTSHAVVTSTTTVRVTVATTRKSITTKATSSKQKPSTFTEHTKTHTETHTGNAPVTHSNEKETTRLTTGAHSKGTSTHSADTESKTTHTTKITKPTPTHSTKTESETEKKTSHTTKTTSTKSTTTSATATTTSGTWEIAMYSDKNCSGDYYLMSGHNNLPAGHCQDLRGGKLSTDLSDTAVSCRWYTDDGFGTWENCASSPLKSPKSWYITNGICSVYDDAACNDTTGYGQAYWSWDHKGCQEAAKFTPPTWGSLQCSIDL